MLSSTLTIVAGSYISRFIPNNYNNYFLLGLGSILFLLILKKGLSKIFLFSFKVITVQALIMAVITKIYPSIEYNFLKVISVSISLSMVIFGYKRLKILVENTILIPLGIVKKQYDKTFNNSSKDNANLNLTIEEIDKLGDNGRDFEYYIAKLYRACGHISKTTMDLKDENDLPESIMNRAGNGEQGADVLVFFNEPQYVFGSMKDGLIIQCKHYSSTVGNTAVQEVVGAVKMYEKHFLKKLHPMVITNNYLTGPAIDLAKDNEVSYIDRDSICKLIDLACNTVKNTKEQLIA
jgi:HJR/Mrr/RecB family endonuclease